MSIRYLPVAQPGRRTRGRIDQQEFARRSGLHPELVRRFVALGLVPAVRDADGVLWFSASQVAAVARLQRLRTALPVNYAALGLVVDLLDGSGERETALRIRGRTEPVRPPAAERPAAVDQEGSTRWS
jgi:chaperone modulatory protein CbpM